MENKVKLQTNDTYEEHYEEFQNSRFGKSLIDYWKVLPYWKRYRILFYGAFTFSILLSLFSAFTEANYLYSIFKDWTGHTIAAIVCVVAVVILIEGIKQILGEPIFKDYKQFQRLKKGFAFIYICATLISITCSFNGSQDVYKNYLADKADMSNVDTLLTNELIMATNMVKQFRKDNTTPKGVVYYDARAELKNLEQQQIEKQEQVNEAIKKDRSRVDGEGQNFGYMTVGSELLLLLCIYYRVSYRYRSVAEFAEFETQPTQTESNNVTHHHSDVTKHVTQSVAQPVTAERTPIGFGHNKGGERSERSMNVQPNGVTSNNVTFKDDVALQALKLALQRARNNYTTNTNRKRNGIGRVSTLNNNITKWSNEIDKLKQAIEARKTELMKKV